MKNLKIVIVLFVVLSLFLSCNKEVKKNREVEKKQEKSYGGTLYLDTLPIRSLNFLDLNKTNTVDVVYQISDSLISQDEKFNYVPRLAEKWEEISDKEIIFYLRKDVYFHDGVKFTADDVIFTYEASLDADFPWGNYKDSFSVVDKLEKIDDYTIKLTYKNPDYDLPGLFVDFFILPKHIYDTKKYTLNNNPANFNPVGTGPFKFVKWEKNSQIVLKANDKYFNGRPYLDKVVFKVLESRSMTYNMLLNNELDIVSLSTVDWKFKTNSTEFRENFYKLRYYTLGVFYIGWNCSLRLFESKYVRQAMAYSVDLNKYNKNVKFNLNKPAATPLHPNVKFFANDLKIYPYKPEKALELLKKAGFYKNNEGLLVDNNGNQFKFEMIISSFSKSFVPFLEYMQENLKQLGIKMEIKVKEEAVYQKLLREKKFDAFVGGVGTSDDPVFLEYLFGKIGIDHGINHMGFVNAECEAIFKKIDNEVDKLKREVYFKKIQHVIYEEQPWLCLYYPPSLLAVNKKVKNIKPSPLGIMQTYPGFKEIYIEK